MKHRAVLFDLDGTLLNTLQDVAGAVNKGLARLGFPQHSVEAYKNLIGEGRDVLALRALPENHRDADTGKKLLDLINADYAIHWADHTRPYPGIPELLDALTAGGIKITVLSNKADDLTNMCVTKLLARWHFALVAGSRPSVPNKPNPAGTLELAKQLDISPAEFLYLGDSDIDMKTAIGAGMYPIGAGWGFRSEQELLAAGAKAVIKQPEELLKYL
ncbi:MAG: HAD family hydrolase [Dehalococcoidales bacterium]